MEKSSIIEALKERLDELEKWRKVTGTKKKETKEKKEDEDVCPVCGGDLLFVEDNIVYCSKCKEYYEMGTKE